MIVHFFAAAREIVQFDSWTVVLQEPITIESLRRSLETQFPALSSLLPRCAFAVNHDYADDAAIVTDRDDVAVLPPVSGG